ncbi:Probable serine/threonine-protein kinase pknK [Gulosibacter sp. 10]|nr:Probable serine/threonine-protein kinase pknK [Gulosibacter sp. 10]
MVAAGEREGAALVGECALLDAIGSEFVELAEETLEEEGVRIAVFPLRPRTSWSSLVARGATLAPGAAVTLLVPLAETLQLAHSHGFAHGALGLGSCFVDGDGRPWVDGWGSAARLDDLPAMKADLAIGADLRALGRVSDAVLARCEAPSSGELRQLVDALQEGVTPSDAAARLVDSLFRWAEPGPVPLEEPGAQEAPAQAAPVLRGLLGPGPARADGAAAEAEHETLLDAPVRVRGRGVRARVPRTAELRERLAMASAKVRPALWLALVATGGAIALGGAATMTGGGQVEASKGGADTVVTAGPSPTAGEGDSTDAGPTGAPGGERETIAAAELDPLEAISELASARNGCLDRTDPECLATVYAAGASGLEGELHLVESLIASGDAADPWLLPETGWTVAAELGDVQLLRADGEESFGASIERTPEGWRFRELWLPDR